MQKYLVTGGCGFVGSNVCLQLLRDGQKVLAVDNLNREGAINNLNELKKYPGFEFIYCDIRQFNDIAKIIGEHEIATIFHLAGQVAMTTSIANPYADMQTNVLGTVNVLEALRLYQITTGFIYASSNKVYGEINNDRITELDLRYEPIDTHYREIDESAALEFKTPYGCSKGAADQYTLDYANIFGLKTAVFRHSTIYGGRQYATFDQGWIGWFCRQALIVKQDSHHEFTINGNGKQVRDLLHIQDAVSCYLLASQSIDKIAGQAFNIGGGYKNSMSLLELFQMLNQKLELNLKYKQLPERANDQKYYVSNTSKAKMLFDWTPQVSVSDGIDDMLDWERKIN